MKFSVVLLLFVLGSGNGIGNSNKAGKRSNVTIEAPTNSIEYYTDITQHKITIPIMIHLDKALTKDLTKEHKRTAKRYFQDVFKRVEKLFSHPSLNQSIQFNILGVKTLRNATKNFQMTENVSTYLKSYCEWQGEKKVFQKNWYYSVLFTGLDVYYLDGKKNKVMSSTGRGYLRGICSVRNSCALLEWHPKNTAYILAHEIAHSLGVNHDGPPHNECREQRFIMSAKYSPHNPATSWSACNKHALKQFLLSKLAWCLQPNLN